MQVRWLSSGLAVAVAVVLASPSKPEPTPRGEALDLCEYRLAWSDEFEDLSIGAWRLEGKRWIAHTPWAGDFGDAKFLDPGPAGPFSVQNGLLRITASKDEKGNWRSGLLAAADETGAGTGIRTGYFETRVRMSSGRGTWPAFWLFSQKPRNDPAPSVEFDAFEFYGHDPVGYQAAWHVHYKSPHEDKTRGELKWVSISPDRFVDEFHTIGIDVSPTWTTFYFDRRSVWRVATPPELDTPLFPLINLALGSGYPTDETPDPSILEVDYVRLFEPVGAGQTREECSPAGEAVAHEEPGERSGG